MKRAPFLCKQSPDRTLEVVILAGSLAWETSRVWRKDPDREDDVPPMVLGPNELADLSNLTIIRPDTLYVRVLRTGDISEEDLLKIAVKLAHAGVQMARLMSPDGELLENWTGQLERLRQERPSDILPDHFRLDEEALWFDKLTERRDGESDVQPQRICSPLRVTAITCDSHDGSYGRLLEWHTTTGQLRRWAMPMAMLSGNGEELRRILLENGLTNISTRPALDRNGWRGFHLRGESTDGKTTVMKVAASVCGGTDYWHSWRATGNALEGIASRHNDALLPLDELREVDPREAGMIAYMLANGQGKGRARTDGEVRNRRHWTLLLFSTGELSLAEHTERAGERIYAGMDVRMVQIPSDTGQHGAFEQLHGFASGQQFADTLCDRVARFHGTAFRAWLAFLTHDQDASTTLARELLRRYQNALMPDNAGNQVQRIVARFALLAAAGEIATLHGITGWQKGTAYEAVQICLHAWLNERGHIANQEDEGVLAQIKRFITAHQYSRFASWDGPDRPLNMAGFRRVEKDPLTGEEHTLFFILPEGWREVCRGFSPARAARLCQEAECLQPGSDGKYQSQVRLPEIGKTRVYRLTSRILSI
ncbi:hypothetical protein BKC11_13690 [Salmonella enterica subsp. enterica serovar Typhimurium]|nr:hypothetical protein BKC11_13690 [Salmonella enterica subsp. enterica serovar Typhimurium]